jgi:hypothetical protein
MMLVSSRFRRRGLATALMRRSLEYLRQHSVQCIKLDATPLGKFVYDQIGFQAEWAFHRWRRAGVPSQVNTAVAETVFPESCRDLDRAAFGVDRRRVLDLLCEQSSVCVIPGGYGMIRPGFLASYIGPVAAENVAAAEVVLRELCSRTEQDIFWDIPGPNRPAQDLARELGFEPVRELTRMWIGEACSPDLRLQYALADLSKG